MTDLQASFEEADDFRRKLDHLLYGAQVKPRLLIVATEDMRLLSILPTYTICTDGRTGKFMRQYSNVRVYPSEDVGVGNPQAAY